jgi:hypothetical protein
LRREALSATPARQVFVAIARSSEIFGLPRRLRPAATRLRPLPAIYERVHIAGNKSASQKAPKPETAGLWLKISAAEPTVLGSRANLRIVS